MNSMTFELEEDTTMKMNESRLDHSYRSVDPATGTLWEQYETASDESIQKTLASAHSAFESWRGMPMSERAAVMRTVEGLFVERAHELARIAAVEMGKRLSQGVDEAKFCADIFAYFAENGEQFTADREISTSAGARAVIQHRPVGVLLGIMPWNYPYYQVARFVAPNILLGNVIVLKHAETCPRAALAIEEIMADAGVPEGVYRNTFASHDQVATIIADPRVQGVSLTGSERAGASVGQLAAKHLKKAVLELGGSDPYILFDSEDVPEAAGLAWATRMENIGQACNSNKRIIVMHDLHDEFVAALVDLAARMDPGDPVEDREGTYGPMASRSAAEHLHAQVQDAVDKGAVLHVGGTVSEGPDAYFAPAVMTGIVPGMRAYDEELFGPVAAVYKVESEAKALQLANDTPFGLGGAVFSSDTGRARRWAEQLEVGMANVNTPAGQGAELPFGGVKRSGFGRELGPLGMDEFVNKRLLYIAD